MADMTIGLQIVTSVLLAVVLGLGAVCLWQWLLIRRKDSMLGRLYDESIKYKNLYYKTVNDRLDAPHSPSSCNDDRLTRLTKEIQEMEEYIQDLELQLLESDEIINRLAGRRGPGSSAQRLVPSIDAQAWPNEIYVGYATGWMRRYDQEFDPDNPAPQKLQPYLADAKTQVQKLLADYKEATAAPQTELIDQADRQRDALIAQVSTMIEAMLKMTLMPQKQQAAQTLKTGWDIYKPTAKAALRDESTQVQQWLEYVHAHAAQGAALAELGLTQIVADLEQQNNEVIRLMDERAAERQQQKTIVLADDRRMADRAMKSCDRVLNAHAILDDDPQRFAVLINALTADQTEWRQRYDDNRRANKRVSVKNDVVGNHLYQTARDWTWARLIEDGKALLAIDPDQPTRILSTDKKAQKAGGLCLALKGVPVKPTDDVDVDKEYQLIPIDSL